MTNWAATTDQVIDNGFGGPREGASINGAIPHHAAGTDALAYVANYNSRNSHPTYHVSRAGTVSGIVHPDRRPFSTANAVDEQVITFEMDNMVAGEPWPIADATIEAVIEVTLDHYRQSPRFGRGFAKNIRGVTQAEFFIGWHSQYVETGCPGKYFLDRIDWLVSELNRRASGSTSEAPRKDDDVLIYLPSSDSKDGVIKGGVSYISEANGPLRPLSREEFGAYDYFAPKPDAKGVLHAPSEPAYGAGYFVPVRWIRWDGEKVRNTTRYVGVLEFSGWAPGDVPKLTGRIIYDDPAKAVFPRVSVQV